MNKAPLEKVLNHITQSAIAREFNISQSAVSQWKHNGIPPSRVIQLEQLLEGKVTRHELCPEYYPE